MPTGIYPREEWGWRTNVSHKRSWRSPWKKIFAGTKMRSWNPTRNSLLSSYTRRRWVLTICMAASTIVGRGISGAYDSSDSREEQQQRRCGREGEDWAKHLRGEQGQIKSFVGLRLILIFVNIRKDSLGGVYDLRRAYEQSPLKWGYFGEAHIWWEQRSK